MIEIEQSARRYSVTPICGHYVGGTCYQTWNMFLFTDNSSVPTDARLYHIIILYIALITAYLHIYTKLIHYPV